MPKSIIKTYPLGFPWKTQDPFLFCVHHRDLYPAGNGNMGPNASLAGRNIGQDFTIKDGWRMYHGRDIPGFPYHPHRGFETITIAEEGYVDHTDSMGGAGRFSSGDVQWMTAGKGILHSEMFPLIHEDKDNTLEIFQIWLNLPARSKMVEPHFKMLWDKQIPVYSHKDERGKETKIRIIAGNFHDNQAPEPTPDSWAANHQNLVGVLTIKLEAGAEYTLTSTDKKSLRSMYFYEGDTLTIDGLQIHANHGIDLDPEEKISLKAGDQACKLLLLQGKPIEEQVVQHGPFVMNTNQEIQEAFAEFRATQFGGWPWSEEEYVHEVNIGRFALHADGRKELPT